MRFGNLTIIQKVDNNKCIAMCDCGVEKEFWFHNITSGRSSSCGCLNRSLSSERYKHINKSHGLANHPLYRVWRAMISRCYNDKDISFKNYGGKGVAVFDAWRNNFVDFYNWAIANGWSERLQLDKDIIGNGLIYSPSTCKFVTRSENCRNRKTNNLLTYNGETKTLAEWCELYNIKHTCVIKRISRGWTINQALVTPVKNNGYVKT